MISQYGTLLSSPTAACYASFPWIVAHPCMPFSSHLLNGASPCRLSLTITSGSSCCVCLVSAEAIWCDVYSKSLDWSQGSPLEDIYFLSQWLLLVGLTILCLLLSCHIFSDTFIPPRSNLSYLHSSSYQFHVLFMVQSQTLSILRQRTIFFYRLIYSIKYFIIKRTCSWTIQYRTKKDCLRQM